MTDPPRFQIAGRSIGVDHPPYVIAEISANHLGDLGRARDLIVAAAVAGADAVKMQHFSADTITVRSDLPEFKVGGGTVWDGQNLYDLYTHAMTPWDWTGDLMALAAANGVALFSSPFDHTAVDFLAGQNVPAYKVASFELNDLPLIRDIASRGKPVILSTGMATLSEIDASVRAAVHAGASSLALLRCNSGYPARAEEMNLRAISVMREIWEVPIGLSDHTLSATAAIAAVALGACIIEKHLILDRGDGGPDAAFSAEPSEFADLVAGVREAHASLGAIHFGPSQREQASLAFRRSLRAVHPVALGETITINNVRSVRPAGGLEPDMLSTILGMTANDDLEQGQAITLDDVRPRPRQ